MIHENTALLWFCRYPLADAEPLQLLLITSTAVQCAAKEAHGRITCRHSALGRLGVGNASDKEVIVTLTNTVAVAVNMEPLEEYHSPFDFEQGVNASYLYLSPAYSDTPPSSPAGKARGNGEGGKWSLCVSGKPAAFSKFPSSWSKLSAVCRFVWFIVSNESRRLVHQLPPGWHFQDHMTSFSCSFRAVTLSLDWT